MRAWLPLLLLSFLIVPVSAQEPCSPAAPCAIPLDMDADSLTFGGAAEFSVTAGDTISFDAFNTDDVAHDISIADLGIEFTVQPFDDAQPGPYTMDAPGDYIVTDLTTGETATLHVVWEDVAGGDGTTTHKDTPAPGPIVTLLAVAFLALLRRR